MGCNGENFFAADSRGFPRIKTQIPTSRNEREKWGTRVSIQPLSFIFPSLLMSRRDEFVNHVFIGELLVGMFAVERLVKADLF
jgi:hypothetical protein